MSVSNKIGITALTSDDRRWMAARSTELWGGEVVISRGNAHRVVELPGFIARIAGERIGVGTALLAAVEDAAGDRRLWLITTNDNLDAIRFYQRRGYVLAAVYPGAIEASRRLKPQIPRVGNYGIPIRDELEFVRVHQTP